MKGRDETIDVLKGIAILLVVLGHIAAAPKLTSVIYSFHMPLFIFISGYLAQHSLLFGKKNAKEISWKRYLYSKTKQLLLPFVAWPCIIAGLLNIPINFNLWYLSCLFCLLEISYFFVKILRKSIVWSLVYMIAVYSLIGILFAYARFKLCSNILVFSIPFYVGWVINQYNVFGNKILCRIILIPSLICFMGGALYFKLIEASVVYTVCKIITGIAASCFLYIVVRFSIQRVSKRLYVFICVMGGATLPIYCIHGLLLHLIRFLNLDIIYNNILVSVLVSFIVCWVCIGIYNYTKRSRLLNFILYGK